MIDRQKIIFDEIGATVELSAFLGEGGVGEWHVMVHVEPRGEMFQQQMERLSRALRQAQEKLKDGDAEAKVVFKRYFLSDATNQSLLIRRDDDCTVSLIQQPPLDGSKVALWAYLVSGAEVRYAADELNSTVVRFDGCEHIWTMGMLSPHNDSYDETFFLLRGYEQVLKKTYNANIADNCIRTWFFVRDVDTNYKGLVDARRENFLENGLSPETHYIASTGIGGSPADTKALVQFGAYAISCGRTKGTVDQKTSPLTGGLGGIQYLYALDHLNKTIEYGVTFERGTVVRYSDRCHAFVSGTASIDNRGQVMYVGDVVRQTYRMWENVEALLKEAEMSFDDVMQIIVYLRDVADYAVVEKLFREKFPDTPYVITLAPVCRPQWLIEMECMAVKSNE